MVKKEKLYAATNGGLDIILDYYPQARMVLDDPKVKHFKRRPNERTASATLRQSPKTGVWQVTDFGDEGSAMSPLDIVMKEDGLTFTEALLKMCGRFGVTDELQRDVNKPEWSERAATAEEAEGAQFYELNEGFTDEELKVLGPLVKREHVESLHWYSVKWWAKVKDRKVKIKHSTATYPIFMRECVVEDGVRFFKLYEPYNYDKGFRFMYWPAGAKPRRYVNGLYELRKAYEKWNAAQAAEWESDGSNEGKPYKMQKLESAFICSGERDALCVRSMGCWPLWLNSETDTLEESEMKEIEKLVEYVYNIPDIDATGVSRGTLLALKYIGVHTVWLPDSLKQYRDHRGHPRKDFRDWLELRPSVQDFRRLINTALPARFWKSRQNKKTGEWTHDIDTACLHEFLRLNGFYILREDADSDHFLYVRIEGHTVTQVTVRMIREFVIQWVRDHSSTVAQYRGVLNLVLNTPKLQGTALESLQSISLNFSSYTPTSQYYYFQNHAVRVSSGGVEVDPAADGHHYIWQSQVQPHDFKELGEMFRVERSVDSEGADVWDIEVTAEGLQSKFLCFLVNTSRIYWRREFEELWVDEQTVLMGGMSMKPEDDEGHPVRRRDYCRRHHFDIAGPLLTPAEILLQKRNLVSKIFTVGFLLHRYKDLSRTWAPFCMDNKVGTEDECNGRSGKSFFISTIGKMMNTVKLSGRNPSLLENQFAFDQVTRQTDLIRVDDCARYFKTEQMYDLITDDMVVNPKNFASFTIPYAESPKIAFTTNYVPADFSASTDARLLYVVFSDYYHNQAPGSDYRESRSIFDDFGKNLYGPDYSEAEWNADFNFMMQALRFYLSMAGESVKIQPNIDDIKVRKYKAEMGSNFEDWADGYFAPESGHLDKLIVRQEAFEDFRGTTNMKNLKMQWFTRALQAYGNLHADSLTLNPEEVLNASGRCIRRDPATGKATEYIYMQSVGSSVTAPATESPGAVAGAADSDDDGQVDMWDEIEKEALGAHQT